MPAAWPPPQTDKRNAVARKEEFARSLITTHAFDIFDELCLFARGAALNAVVVRFPPLDVFRLPKAGRSLVMVSRPGHAAWLVLTVTEQMVHWPLQLQSQMRKRRVQPPDASSNKGGRVERLPRLSQCRDSRRSRRTPSGPQIHLDESSSSISLLV